MAKMRSSGVDSAASWFVAAAGFLLQCMAVGSNRANGLLFVAFVDHNQCSREEASWPFTMPGVGIIFFAPLTGYLITKFAVRAVSMLGVLLMAVGTSACFFSTNVYYVSAFFGIVRGAGYSLCLNTVPGTINESFLRHRATAMGIAFAGDSVGSFLFPLIVKHLLDVYFLKGTFLLLGALCLHGAYGAMMLVPPRKASRNDNNRIKNTDDDTSNGALLNKPETGSSSLQKLEFRRDNTEKNGSFSRSLSNNTYNNLKLTLDAENEYKSSRKQRDLGEDLYSAETERGQNNKGNVLLDQIESAASVNSKNEVDERNGENGNSKALQPLLESSMANVKITNVKITNGKLTPYEPTYKQSMKNIFSSRGFYVNTVTQIVDMFFISNFNLVIVDYVADKGTPFDQGLFMLTVFAAGQFVGRLGLGWITDRKYLSRPIFLFLAMNINAALMVLLISMNTYATLMVCGTVLGIVGGTILPVSNVLFTDHLRKEDINVAIGLSISIKGLFYLIRIPLIGYCRDQIGSYDLLFYIMAGMSCFAAFTWIFEWTYLKIVTRKASARISGTSLVNVLPLE